MKASISIRIDADLLKRFKKAAVRDGITITGFIRAKLEEFTKQKEK